MQISSLHLNTNEISSPEALAIQYQGQHLQPKQNDVHVCPRLEQLELIVLQMVLGFVIHASCCLAIQPLVHYSKVDSIKTKMAWITKSFLLQLFGVLSLLYHCQLCKIGVNSGFQPNLMVFCMMVKHHLIQRAHNKTLRGPLYSGCLNLSFTPPPLLQSH